MSTDRPRVRLGRGIAIVSGLIAALPMYDWPERADEVDAEWAALRDRLRAAGVDAPKRLVRRNADMPAVPGGIRNRGGEIVAPDPASLPPDELDLPTLWRHPGLLLGQTCWGPIRAHHLLMEVSVVGQPDYSDVEGGSGRRYRSAIVMRRDKAAMAMPPPQNGASAIPFDLIRGRSFAYNETDSMSGMMGIAEDIAAFGTPHRFFSALVPTGGHRASIKTVSEGRAEVCAIDCRSWALAQRFEPAARDLVVVGWTAARMGLPFISARGLAGDHGAIRRALARPPFDEASLRARLVQGGIAAPHEIVGCTAAEIASLEARFGCSLPASYRTVLSVMGHGAGRFVDPNEFAVRFDQLDRINADARDMLADAAEDGLDLAAAEDAFFIISRQRGEAAFVVARGGADSPVSMIADDGTIVPVADSVWQWIDGLCADTEFFIGAGLR